MSYFQTSQVIARRDDIEQRLKSLAGLIADIVYDGDLAGLALARRELDFIRDLLDHLESELEAAQR